MTNPIEHEIATVNALSKQLLGLLKDAANPGIALNALLTAYINLADTLGLLEMVPGAGVALGHAAEQLLTLRSAASPSTTTSTSIH